MMLKDRGITSSTARQLYNSSSLFLLIPKYISDTFRQFVNFISTEDRTGPAIARFARHLLFSWKYCCHNGYVISQITGLTRLQLIPDSNEKRLVVIGSDQVWNYQWISEGDLRLRFGLFHNSGIQQTIAYAASIGVDSIDDDVKPIFNEGISRLSWVSVREDRAGELIKSIVGRDAPVVLDPTLMVSAARWKYIFKNFVKDNDKYILTYFLGTPNEEQEAIIKSSAMHYGVRVRRLNDARDPKTFCAGPAEFVEIISKAKYVFTDSYHACCFSILFNVPFKVFDRHGFAGRSSMNSRMRTLCRLFELDGLVSDDDTFIEFDWKRINQLLEAHRLESNKWFNTALGSIL